MSFQLVDVDEQPAETFTLVDEESPGFALSDAEGDAIPATAEDVGRRFLNPDYTPSLAEFKTYQKARKSRTIGQHASDDLKIAGSAISGLWDTVVAGVKAIPAMVKDPEANDPIMTTVEAVKRGTKRDIELAAKLLPDQLMSRVFGSNMNFDQYVAARVSAVNRKKFEGVGLNPENAKELLQPGQVDPATLSQWRKEYGSDFIPQSDYEKFLEKRKTTLDEITAARKAIPGVNTDLAETMSLVASPSTLIPFGKALAPAKSLTRAVTAKALEGAGKSARVLGEKTIEVAKLPERGAAAATRFVGGTEDDAAKATERVAAGVAGVSTLPLKAAGKTASMIGETAEAIGRQSADGPSRFGLFDRIAKDSTSPEWLRRVANIARPIDPAVSLAGSAGKGATEGAAIGTVLGAAADGEEGAAAGFGSGMAMGAGGAILGRMASGGKYRAGLEDMDLARWLASKPDEQVQNIANLKLTRDQTLALADTERLARGVGNDVEFRYLKDKEFTDLFGIGKGAQTVSGDRPIVFVNTGYKGPRSAFHEVLHALDALEGSTPQRQALNRVLFDQSLPDGTPVSKGVYSAADVAEFTSQYRSRLNESARSEFDLLTPEDRQQRIMSEVRAESFANLLGDSRPGVLRRPFSLRTRVTDSLLLADQTSMLGKMRRALESVGVKFNASGEPSELFVRDGKPITNTPAVDAGLREYLRTKDQISRKLVAGDEPDEPSLVVRPQDLMSKGNAGLIYTFKDADIIAKNPDGTVKMLGGVPVLLSEREIKTVQTKRVDAMLSALDASPDVGVPDAVRKKENGAYEGKFFSDKQMAALQKLPDEILSPSMKEKLRQLNELAKQDGAQIILDYNAALKSGRYSSGIAPTTRAAVPLTFNISKAGNFYMATLDTTHFFRKLGEWRRTKTKAFAPWNGDIDAFMRDSFAYLDNHVNGRAGSVNLDADAAVAIQKKNLINDFFNVPKGKGNEDLNPVQLSTRANKDNLIRSRRFDRINRITPGAGDRFPIRYDMQKRNFLPAQRGIASEISPLAIQKQVRSQAEFDLAAKMTGPANMTRWLASACLDALDKRLNQKSRLPRTDQLKQVAAVAKVIPAHELNQVQVALLTRGQRGAQAAAEHLATMKSIRISVAAKLDATRRDA